VTPFSWVFCAIGRTSLGVVPDRSRV
jgi:hypothetical protein